MAKVDTDAQAQAVQTLLAGLSLKRKQELIERNDRLRMQFLQTQKMAAGKAREPQINTFLGNVVGADKKIRELVFSAWLKDNATTLGEIPDLPERFKRDGEAPEGEEGELEADIKDATAALKKWIKTTDADLVGVYARLGPYELPAKVLTAAKKPKAKETAAAEPAEPGAEAPVAAGGVSEAALAELRNEFESQREKLEARLQKQEEETEKFKRLLEENKDRRKADLTEVQEKHRSELSAKQAEWQRSEANLKREIAELQKARQDQADKTSKARDEMLPLRQQIDRLEKELKRAHNQAQEAQSGKGEVEGEVSKLRERLKLLESAQQELVAKEKQLARFEKKGAAVALASSDNLKIWEEALNEQEVKEAFKRTFNLDTIGVNTFEHDEKDLAEVWKQLLVQEQDLVTRFFALPFDELYQPSEDFREMVTSFIELKDSLVAREQLAHLLNFVGNRFLQGFKQKV